MTSELVRAIHELAEALPTSQRKVLCARLDDCQDVAAARSRGIDAAIPAPEFGAGVRQLLAAWAAAGGGSSRLTGAGVALALDATGAAVEASRERQVTAVWTGPDAGLPVRLTAAVMQEVIARARERLLVLSYAAYKIPQVLDGLRAAVARGVQVDVILETAADSAGKLQFDQLDEFLRLEGVHVWHWPADQRPVPGAALHAKAIAADGTVALVTSANLTGHALASNIELGLLIRDPAAVGRIDGHVRALADRGILRRVPSL